jgi:hypothetical protein
MPVKTKPHEWSRSLLGTLFGISQSALCRYLDGQAYPSVQMIQKFEIVLGWPAAEQFDLIPPYWEWPTQFNGRGGVQGEPTDLRYGMKLGQVLREWTEANPRTVPSGGVRQHPSIPRRAGSPRKRK